MIKCFVCRPGYGGDRIPSDPLMAQGVGVEVPGVGGVGVSETRQRDYDRDYDRPYRDYDRRHYREHRERRYRGECKIITIERDDGSVKRIRRCD